MRRRHHYRRRSGEPVELDMTTFLNLMVVLVPFLLITAVFSRITVVELSLPSATGQAAPAEVGFRLEVIVRDEGMELSNGSALIARIPKAEDAYDLVTLSEYVRTLKQDHPEAEAASVLLEPEIAYDHLIQVMDVVRATRVPVDPDDPALVPPGDEDAEGSATDTPEAGDAEAPRFVEVALFPDIAIGDAP